MRGVDWFRKYLGPLSTLSVPIILNWKKQSLTAGYFISCLAPNVNIATAIGPAFILPFLLFGGFFTNPELVPSWLSWIEHISWFNYANEILFVNQWEGYQIECEDGQGLCGVDSDGDGDVDCNCIYNTGEDVLTPYSFDVVSLS